jgi:hypothetical protein
MVRWWLFGSLWPEPARVWRSRMCHAGAHPGLKHAGESAIVLQVSKALLTCCSTIAASYDCITKLHQAFLFKKSQKIVTICLQYSRVLKFFLLSSCEYHQIWWNIVIYMIMTQNWKRKNTGLKADFLIDMWPQGIYLIWSLIEAW